jgi:hypothetical protein
MSPEPHISDVAGGNAAVCKACGAANAKDAAYCRECGQRLSAVKIPSDGASGDIAATRRKGASPPGMTRDDAGGDDDHRDEAGAAVYEITPSSPPELRKYLLEKLDMMERELETTKQEAFPESERKEHVDKLDEYEEALKNIAFRLDALISDLLKAEAREYSFSDLTRVDGDSFVQKSAAAKIDRLKMKSRNTLETIVLVVLIAVIFLTGMIFGLWGGYFFGIPQIHRQNIEVPRLETPPPATKTQPGNQFPGLLL